jgi:hypothetical protein
MPLPESWFVYDPQDEDWRRFSTYPTKEQAQMVYDKAIAINRTLMVGHDQEWDGDETVYFGQVHAHAQVVPVAMDDEGEEIFDLVSYSTLPGVV